MQITDIETCDLADVLDLNEASVPHVSSLTAGELAWFADNAHYFRVVRDETGVAGFLVGLRPGLPYRSLNYRWFSDNYDDFGYVDRVAVDARARRKGIASLLYDDFARTLSGKVEVMTCEVNLRPSNESSMRYHARHDFVQVGRQQTEGGTKEVALMEKKL